MEGRWEVGSLVRARGRDWVVQPGSVADMLVVQPLGGAEIERCGIDVTLEAVEPARFAWPGRGDIGDFAAGRLLRDAIGLGLRASSGPLRCVGHLHFAPRPYQLVPLLMALRQRVARLLIADDVGIGKTLEAGLIARELLDRSEIERFCVLTPPHLAEQWQVQLRDKLDLPVELVLRHTVGRLERGLRAGESLFDRHPFTVVSIDFIKGDRRRDDFLRAAPELVIVDEAHGVATGDARSRGQHHRHDLVARLAERKERHLLLLTATPHAGKADAFRSLLALLDPALAALPDDLSGEHHRRQREQLARHLVLRRRPDVERYLGTDTVFPRRVGERERAWAATPAWRQLLEAVWRQARQIVVEAEGSARHRQRVHWWAALGLLRAYSSSPPAAAASLRARCAAAAATSAEDADAIGREALLDASDEEWFSDADPGALPDDGAAGASDAEQAAQARQRQLLALARDIDALAGERDPKLQAATALVRELIDEGRNPILFCRFIATARYVAAHLQSALRKVEVAAVTGELVAEERHAAIARLASAERRLLVATDCLSEGIDLQHAFDAVVHYDLAWNPTRHEQREGRVDRYGQPNATVRTVLFLGRDNPVDGRVVEVLLRKHQQIRAALGISVPVPIDSEAVVEALFEGLLLRQASNDQLQLALDDVARSRQAEVERAFDEAERRERASRSLYAQHAIDAQQVQELASGIDAALGEGIEPLGFVERAARALGGRVQRRQGRLDLVTEGMAQGAREALGPLGRREALTLINGVAGPGETAIYRTHPLVAGLAAYVAGAALEGTLGGRTLSRAGVLRTDAVATRTTLLLLRLRLHLHLGRGAGARTLLAEEAMVAAFAGPPEAPRWLDDDAALRALLDAVPRDNVAKEQAALAIDRVAAAAEDVLEPALAELARRRAEALLAAHRRVRDAAGLTLGQVVAEPLLPVDVLGVWVLLPVPTAAGGGAS